MRGVGARPSPSGIKTFGSTFKNPEDERAEGRSAGQLLDAAGCRGLRVGGARFAEKHANFVENVGDATTADVLELMAAGRRRVHERFGVELEPEVQVLGDGRVAHRVGAVRRGRLAVAALLAVAAFAAVYWFALRDSTVVARVPRPGAHLDDRQPARKRSGSARTGRSCASCRCPKESSCRSCR